MPAEFDQSVVEVADPERLIDLATLTVPRPARNSLEARGAVCDLESNRAVAEPGHDSFH
jgi:hypothetical protein